MKPSLSRTLLLGAGVLTLVACGKSAPKAPPHRPPPQVSAITVQSQTVPLTRQVVGRLAATRVAQVRARVAGIVLKRTYTEGTDVKAGQVLFELDPAPLQATLHARQAALAKAEADAANAATTAKRYRELYAKKLLSPQDLDTALANARSTAAAVKQAQADVESARLNLGYATVTAPIAGRAGRALVSEGALVGQGEATELTTVEQIDPIYVNFTESADELRRLEAVAGAAHSAKVEVLTADGRPYPHAGTIDFTGVDVDPSTGTVSLRAVLPNPQHRLLPGMFVTARLTMGRLQHAYLLPQAAVLRDGHGAYVLVVDSGGKVAQRRMQTHGMTRTDWIATGKLQAGDRVIVEGLQKVRPGTPATVAPAAGNGPAKS
jgi:membrane fusion protein (multidrug efflux system)